MPGIAHWTHQSHAGKGGKPQRLQEQWMTEKITFWYLCLLTLFYLYVLKHWNDAVLVWINGSRERLVTHWLKQGVGNMELTAFSLYIANIHVCILMYYTCWCSTVCLIHKINVCKIYSFSNWPGLHSGKYTRQGGKWRGTLTGSSDMQWHSWLSVLIGAQVTCEVITETIFPTA